MPTPAPVVDEPATSSHCATSAWWRGALVPWASAIVGAVVLWLLSSLDRRVAGRWVQGFGGAVVQTVRRHGGVVAVVLGGLALLTWGAIAFACWRERRAAARALPRSEH